MLLKPQHLFTHANQTTTTQKILQFPLTRIVLAILFIVPVIFFMGFFTENLHGVEKRDQLGALIVVAGQVISFLGLISLSILYIYLIERRTAHEYSLSKSIPEWLYGASLGLLLIGLVALINFILGYYQVAGIGWDAGMLKWTFIFWTAAMVEEILLRAIIFRITEEYLGSWIAILIQAVLFGFMHAGNPDATLWSSIAITIEAGILLAAAFMLTRRIWFAFGLHFSWNWFQGVFFGVDVSGNEVEGILKSVVEGPAIITGGEFGFETSILALVFCTSTGIYLLYLAKKRGQFVLPFWKRSKQLEN